MTVPFVVDYQLSPFQLVPCSTIICYRSLIQIGSCPLILRLFLVCLRSAVQTINTLSVICYIQKPVV